MKLVCAWCGRVIAGPTVNIEDDDYEAFLICKSCANKVFGESTDVDIPKVYEAIQAKSGRYEN
jgi:ribosome-binding protein aMBF1 (putative translation factor)